MSSGDWKKNLLPASFRGVSFFIASSDFVTGRRTNQHEFPDRTEPFAEDLGKISDSFSISGHIIGDDYFEIRNRLIEACQKEGPGELIHPYYGLKYVQCGSISFKEDQSEGRIVRFDATFKEAGDNRYPKGANDKGAQLAENVEAALSEAEADFANKFSVENQPGFSLDAARGWISNAQDSFNSATEDVATVADGIAELAFSTRNLVAETEDLLQSPARLANRLLNSLSLIRGAVDSALDAFSSLSNLFGFGEDDPVPISTTPTRERIAQNKIVFDNYIKLAGALRASEDAADTEWPSLDLAREARDRLLTVFEEQIETTDNDELYQAIKNVTSSLIDLVPDADADLPQVKEINIENTKDTLNITYDFFENLDNEQDIIDRNNVTNPAFVLPGEIIEVIDDRRRSQG